LQTVWNLAFGIFLVPDAWALEFFQVRMGAAENLPDFSNISKPSSGGWGFFFIENQSVAQRL
jgi:hypothetical protein